MKRNKTGFLLIEWMIHFLLLSILLLVAATLLISWHTNVTHMGLLCDNALSIYLAADVLRSDVHNAHIITGDAKELHIEYPYTGLVWLYDGNALWRQKVVYQQGSWNKPFKALFAQHIDKSNFIAKPVSSVSQAILVTWQVNEKTCMFVSRNGLLV